MLEAGGKGRTKRKEGTKREERRRGTLRVRDKRNKGRKN
jgi:hypothetical protein